jgi:hypothetical protein
VAGRKDSRGPGGCVAAVTAQWVTQWVNASVCSRRRAYLLRAGMIETRRNSKTIAGVVIRQPVSVQCRRRIQCGMC